MKEIKIRVFDTETKKMIYFPDLEWMANNSKVSLETISDAWVDPFVGWHLRMSEKMLCIGIKDKNGTPIFEGDIASDGKLTGIVEFIDTEFCAMTKLNEEGCSHNLLAFLGEDIEVIGNIHQNTDLLKP